MPDMGSKTLSRGPGIMEGPALAGGIPPQSLPDFIRMRCRRHPGDVALVDGTSGVAVTYGMLDRQIGRCAAGLAARGFKAGDVMLMYAPNSPEWPIAALGAMAAGGVASGANPMDGVAELATQIRSSGASFVFTVPSLLAHVWQAALAAGRTVTVIADGVHDTLSLAGLLACEDPEPGPVQPDMLAALPYSSGTTGLPKGVMLTHRALVSNICQYTQALPAPASAVVLAFLPMYHITGFTVVTLSGLAMGARIVTVPRFEPDTFLGAISRHRVSRLNTVPPVMHFLARHPLVDAYDLSSLELVGCGAAPLGAALEEDVARRLKCEVGQGFGMTESCGCITVSPPNRVRPGSSGRLLPGTQARVVDAETRADAACGEAGEIWFRGPQAFAGYRGQPAATRETITGDGWVRTGDFGFFDEDGYLYITDRLKEIMKVKGFQVAPAELEALLLTHPAIADAAVIGRPDPRAGELPVACVVSRNGRATAATAEEIMGWVAARVAAHKRLADVVLCDAIPRSAAGKILRRALRALDAQRLAAGQADPMPSLERAAS